MADLPTNYLDDILSASMGGKRRFKITHLNGTSEEVTIEDISKYDQVGSTFGAGDINKTNQAVNEKFDSGDVVDPMLTTEPGFAADAYYTKLQFDEQNKNLAPEYYALQNMIDKSEGIVELKKQGNIATLTFDSLKLSKNISSRTTLGYVPSDLKPKFDTKVLGYHVANSKGMPCIVGVTTNGEVYVIPFDWSGSSVSTLLYLSLVLTWEV